MMWLILIDRESILKIVFIFPHSLLRLVKGPFLSYTSLPKIATDWALKIERSGASELWSLDDAHFFYKFFALWLRFPRIDALRFGTKWTRIHSDMKQETDHHWIKISGVIKDRFCPNQDGLTDWNTRLDRVNSKLTKSCPNNPIKAL